MEEYKGKALIDLISTLEVIHTHHTTVLKRIMAGPEAEDVKCWQSLLHKLISEESKVRNALRSQGIVEWKKI